LIRPQGQCGVCETVLRLLGKIQLTQEERSELLRRAEESIRETTAILRARGIKV